MNAHTPSGSCALFYGSIFFVEKRMRTRAVEYILVENIHTCIKEFEVAEKIVLRVSSLSNFFFSLSLKHNSEDTVFLQPFKSYSAQHKSNSHEFLLQSLL